MIEVEIYTPDLREMEKILELEQYFAEVAGLIGGRKPEQTLGTNKHLNLH